MASFSVQQVDCTTQLVVVSKFAGGTLVSAVHVADKDFQQHRSRY